MKAPPSSLHVGPGPEGLVLLPQSRVLSFELDNQELKQSGIPHFSTDPAFRRRKVCGKINGEFSFDQFFL